MTLRRIDELKRVCAELYQVLGCISEYAGIWNHPDVIKAMDNASAARLEHKDLLPWPEKKLPRRKRINHL